MTKTLSTSSAAIVEATARGLTRRKLLRNAGGVALGTSLATALVLRGPEPAYGCASSSPCGPAPLCGCTRCNDGYNWQCDGAEDNTDPARWGSGSQPCSPSYGNCWNEGGYHCCDCCARDAGCTTGSSCYSCGSGTWHKCICREGVC